MNDGSPSEKAIFEEVNYIHKYLMDNPNMYDENNLVIMGYSIGTGMAMYATTLFEENGVILLAPYNNGVDLYNSYFNIFHGPLRGLLIN